VRQTYEVQHEKLKPFFHRLHHLPLKSRRTKTVDPRLVAPRAGYPFHKRNDHEFWKSAKGGKVQLPTYNQELFCEGFDITALDFYIVRHRLIGLLYRDGLYEKKRKKANQSIPEAEYEYAVVEEKISQHILLSGKHVHPYWKRKMISEFITKTAEWMSRAKLTYKVDGEPVAVGIFPSHTPVNSKWTWGPDVRAKKYQNKDYPTLSSWSILVKADNSVKEHAESFRFASLLPLDEDGNITAETKIHDAEYDKLWALVKKKWSFGEDENEEDFGLVYRNPYWGNELIRIIDDQSLHVALETLRTRGTRSVTFTVSSCVFEDGSLCYYVLFIS